MQNILTKEDTTASDLAKEAKNLIDFCGGKAKAKDVNWTTYFESLTNDPSGDLQERAVLFRFMDELIDKLG